MEFIKPNASFSEEYLAACQESIEHRVTEWMPVRPEELAGWPARALHIYALLERGEGLPVGVPRTVTYWCVEGSRFVGELQLRPDLTAEEARSMSHIGYAVRHSMWGRGYGTKLLRFAVETLRAAQISPIYIACHTDNAASDRVCRKIGFSLLETRIDRDPPEHVYVL